ncbi:MAG: ATP-binding protein, partial [Acidimicrobiales bacterium]
MRARGVPPAHRATTIELRTLYPFVVPDDLGVDGCYVGREASGGLFCFDPWECYAKGKLTSPNIVVLGQIGRGKSALVKSFAWRQLTFGRQCWVLDPKGEYAAFA